MRKNGKLPELIAAYEKEYNEMTESARTVKDSSSEASLYEQLAEECCELAHACLKKARKLRGESPTPMEMEEIDANVSEEYTDVHLVSELLNLRIDIPLYWEKYDRWCRRLSS